jgi:hypothetical protein
VPASGVSTRIIRALREGEAGGAIRLGCARRACRREKRWAKEGIGSHRGVVRAADGDAVRAVADADRRERLGEDAYDAGGDCVMNDGLVVFAHDIDAGFLLGLIRTK